MSQQIDPNQTEINRFLLRLRRHLRPLPIIEQEEIIRETESHLLDRLDECESSEQAISELGDPVSYARCFVEDYRVEKALISGSTWRMLGTASSLLGRGFFAFFGFLFFLSIFAIAFGLLFIALLKPFAPEYVGLWTSTGYPGFIFGFTGNPGSTELLGWLIIPLGLIGGGVLYMGSSRLLRAFLSRLARNRQ